MEVRELRYFLAVAREENITRAAESLHIAQPSLSKQLMELEKKLGKKLLIRGKRKITLTEEGVLLAQAGRRNPGTGGEDPAGNQLRYGRCHRRYLYGWRYAAIGSWGSCEASGTISGCEVSFLQWRCHRRVGAIEPWNTGFCSYAAAH